jgi:hypothetical protein
MIDVKEVTMLEYSTCFSKDDRYEWSLSPNFILLQDHSKHNVPILKLHMYMNHPHRFCSRASFSEAYINNYKPKHTMINHTKSLSCCSISQHDVHLKEE